MVYTIVVVGGGLYSRLYIKKKKYTSVNGLKLLVLRVFGITKNTHSLFGHIVKRWPLIGPVVTITDPTYAQFSFARLRYKLIIVLALPSLVFMALIPQAHLMVLMGVLIVATTFAGYPFYSFGRYGRLEIPLVEI